MIAFFKRLFRSILEFFNSPKSKDQEPILYYDKLILFRNAPLIGKIFHEGKKMYRVVYKEPYKGRWKCQLELI